MLGGTPYSTLISNAGGGISRHGDVAVNRWRVDATRDNYGQWCYVRNVRAGSIWSATHQPVCAPTLWYRASFASDRATFERRDGDIETRTEIVVPFGLPAELRRVTVTNRSSDEAEIELTSYQEIVLAPILSDRGHRAFGNLFVQTEWIPESNSLLAMRRPRSAVVKPVWGGHCVAVASNSSPVSCETDRSVFVGRGRLQRNPIAMDNPGELAGTVGAVLDPVLALRTGLIIPSGESASVVFTTFYAHDREDALALAAGFCKLELVTHHFDAAAVPDNNGVAGLSDDDAAVYQELAGQLIFGATTNGQSAIRTDVKGDRRDLIEIGLTGELPIVVARIGKTNLSGGINEMLGMHRYWSLKGLDCDLVILVEGASEDGRLKQEIDSLITPSGDDDTLKGAGSIFVFDAGQLSGRQSFALADAARIQVDCDQQTLRELANV